MKKSLTILFLLTIQATIFAQDKWRVNVNDVQQCFSISETRAIQSRDMLIKELQLDSVQANLYYETAATLDRKYFLTMQTKNYKLEDVLHEHRIELKHERDEFMKNLLREDQYVKYESLLKKIIAAEIKKNNWNPKNPKSLTPGRKESAGWDLLLHDIEFVEE